MHFDVIYFMQPELHVAILPTSIISVLLPVRRPVDGIWSPMHVTVGTFQFISISSTAFFFFSSFTLLVQ